MTHLTLVPKSQANRIAFQVPSLFPQMDRIQRRIMARDSWLSEHEFTSASAEDQTLFLNWLKRQSND